MKEPPTLAVSKEGKKVFDDTLTRINEDEKEHMDDFSYIETLRMVISRMVLILLSAIGPMNRVEIQSHIYLIAVLKDKKEEMMFAPYGKTGKINSSLIDDEIRKLERNGVIDYIDGKYFMNNKKVLFQLNTMIQALINNHYSGNKEVTYD